MRKVVTLHERHVCDRCGREYEYDPALGERNGQPVALSLAASTRRRDLCATCVTKLLEWWGPDKDGEISYQAATLPWPDSMGYLPVELSTSSADLAPNFRPATPESE